MLKNTSTMNSIVIDGTTNRDSDKLKNLGGIGTDAIEVSILFNFPSVTLIKVISEYNYWL